MIDHEQAALCRQRWDRIAKPLRSLGQFEELVCRLAGIQKSVEVRLDRRVCLVVCADNGVLAEGVSQTTSAITALQSASIAQGNGTVNTMARVANCDVVAVDVGILSDVEEPGLLRRKLRRGTGNIARGPAMTLQEMEGTIQTGIDLVGEMKAKGYQIVCTGEMGIGNTTTTSAVASVLLGVDPEVMTGRGAGLSDEGLRRKLDAVRRAISVNKPDPEDPKDVLMKLGGLDIASMVGIYLGGAAHGLPIVVDGVISSVAALLAMRINPAAQGYMLASHLSREPAAGLVMEALGLHPLIHADLALGEGTGAVALLPLIDLALAVYQRNYTFDQLQMEAYTFQGGDKA